MGKWDRYWRKKGHIPKNRVHRYKSIDSSALYDRESAPAKKGGHWLVDDCRIKFCLEGIWFSFPAKEEYCYLVLVEATKCNYGGERHWFLCPNSACKRRCKRLYLSSFGYFLCRKCLNLAYFTQNRSRLDRIIDKKWDLVHKLGASSDFILNSEKPKGMHWKTFNKKRDLIEELDHQATMGIIERFGADIYDRWRS